MESSSISIRRFSAVCIAAGVVSMMCIFALHQSSMHSIAFQSRHALSSRHIAMHHVRRDLTPLDDEPYALQRRPHRPLYTKVASHPHPTPLLAIGDVHGDVDGFAAALKIANAIDDDRNWIGGNLVVVQVGDQVDRGTSEKALFELVHKLQEQAAAAGGALHVLLGNHELLNVFGAFGYVTEEGFSDFAHFGNESTSSGSSGAASGRAAAFSPGGPVAKAMANRPISLIIEDTLFVHAGVLKEHITIGLDHINKISSEFLMGNTSLAEEVQQTLMTANSPVWTRRWSEDFSEDDCTELYEVLQAANVSRMVIGHTLQRNGITSSCNGALWRIDVGISSFFRSSFDSRIEVLDLTGGIGSIMS